MADAFTADTENEHPGKQATESPEQIENVVETVQAQTQPEVADEEAPDVTEQIAAIRDQQNQILERLPEDQPAPEAEDFYSMLYDEPQQEGPTPEEVQQYQQMAYARQQAAQQQAQQQQAMQDPYAVQEPTQAEQQVVQLERQVQTLREAMIGREEQDNEQALHSLAQEHKDFLGEEGNARAVRDTVYQIAGDDELLRTAPALVRTAILAAKANAAAMAGTPTAAEAAGQGASIETAAGAAVSQDDEVDDVWEKAFSLGQGGDPFTT